MTVYLDIGQVRIQQYLSRSPDLAGRRGASALIADSTSDKQVRLMLDGLVARDPRFSSVQPNAAAGEVDGVVSVTLENLDLAPEVARSIMTVLREQVPSAEFEAAWGAGASYVEASRSAMEPARARGDVLRSFPNSIDLPLFGKCAECGLDPATHAKPRRDNTQTRVCADCWARLNADAEHRRSTEQWLLSKLEQGLQLAEDFPSLSSMGVDEKQNHLATVAIDGNSVGRFFKDLANSHVADNVKDEVSRGLVEATRSALRAASDSIVRRTGSSVLPLIPHVVGGDDVLASVPASLAWRFAISFLEYYQAGCADLLEHLEIDPDISEITLTASAGIAFAQQKEPFATTQEVAHRMLARAKSRSRGSVATVMWVDLTQDGFAPPTTRQPWTIERWRKQEDAIGAAGLLAHENQSAYYRLVEAARSGGGETAVKRQVRRLGIDPPLADLVADSGLEEFVDVLDVARWWYS